MKYSGSEWLKPILAHNGRQEMSELGIRVADVLGQVYRGLYHIGKEVNSKKVDWSNPYWISVILPGGLYSFDNSHLTELLVLCFDNMLRLEVNPKAPSYVELMFHQRETRDPSASISKRLPTLDDFIKIIRNDIGLQETGEGVKIYQDVEK